MALSTAYFWCFGHCIDWLSYEAKIYPNNALVTEVKMRGGMTGWQDEAIFKTEKKLQISDLDRTPLINDDDDDAWLLVVGWDDLSGCPH